MLPAGPPSLSAADREALLTWAACRRAAPRDNCGPCVSRRLRGIRRPAGGFSACLVQFHRGDSTMKKHLVGTVIVAGLVLSSELAVAGGKSSVPLAMTSTA